MKSFHAVLAFCLCALLAAASPALAGNTTPSTTVLTSSPDPSTVGQAVTLTATVTGQAGVPSGNVTFLDGMTPLGTVALNASGVATFTTAAFTAGTHTLSAQYAGNGTYLPSAGADTQTVNAAAGTTTALTVAPNPAPQGQPVTLTATVTSSSTPTGTVTFFDGATPIGTSNLNGSGVATLTTSTLAAGSHSITATYNGDASHSGSTSAPVALVVQIAAPASIPALSTLGLMLTALALFALAYRRRRTH
jgi:hypothetical protein